MEQYRMYRGKRRDNSEWVYGDLVKVPRDMGQGYWDPPSSELVTYITNSSSIQREWIEIDPTTIGQCTGRKDKEDTLIYEGDVVRKKSYPEEDIVVQWNSIGKWNISDYILSNKLKIISSIHDKK